jgi:steroid 5-alpha reductase family enzyme
MTLEIVYLTQTAWQSAALIFACVTALWLLSLAIKNASIVDIFWGTGFVLIAAVVLYRSQFFIIYLNSVTDLVPWRAMFIGALVALWGLRLSLHIFARNHGKPEDFRYAAWREQYGEKWWWYSYLHVFLLQGVLLWIISTPIWAAGRPMASPFPNWLDMLGALVWLVGFIFEGGGDWQLAQFKKDPANKGKLLTTGLWKYTRHPNYFGDAVQWWGFYLIALAAGGWWTIFAPVIMTFLLMRVSGVAMLEKAMQVRPGYEDYTQNTPAFFPWKFQ